MSTRVSSLLWLAIGLLLVLLAALVESGRLRWVDQWAVDHVMVGLRQTGAASPGLSSLFPIFNPSQHRGHLAVAALTYVVTFPASVVPAMLLVSAVLVILIRRGRPRLGLALAAMFALATALELAGKAVVTRPTLILHRSGLPPARLHAFDATFPSGHAARAVLVAVALGTCLPCGDRYLFGWVAAVALSLLVAAAHAPSDVLGGLLLGVLLGLLALGRAVRD